MFKKDFGGGAGGNISERDRKQLATWARLYERAALVCRILTEPGSDSDRDGEDRAI
ncbi:MAG: hypothetical protein KDA81_13870 [Planctomycetaceae bacterium]|nr:hypothetical protein [Planctomycetaceae bacterium]